jgi:hypothetical protein
MWGVFIGFNSLHTPHSWQRSWFEQRERLNRPSKDGYVVRATSVAWLDNLMCEKKKESHIQTSASLCLIEQSSSPNTLNTGCRMRVPCTFSFHHYLSRFNGYICRPGLIYVGHVMILALVTHYAVFN